MSALSGPMQTFETPPSAASITDKLPAPKAVLTANYMAPVGKIGLRLVNDYKCVPKQPAEGTGIPEDHVDAERKDILEGV